MLPSIYRASQMRLELSEYVIEHAEELSEILQDHESAEDYAELVLQSSYSGSKKNSTQPKKKKNRVL